MFSFKQFTIQQNQCAQKVSEVACIQGAWTEIPENCHYVLDIGSGTGLLSLILAQRYNIKIDAIEIDLETFKQGRENILSSRFKDKINCLHGDIKSFEFKNKYDFVITNPPFFEGQLKANTEKANTAKHSDKLSLKDLLDSIDQLLMPFGQFSIIFPYERKQELELIIANYQLFPLKYLVIRHSSAHHPKVFVGIFSREQKELIVEEFMIKINGVYTQRMNNLMKPYYLNIYL